MPVSGSEIASLDFANLIGGPLNAVIQAQAKAAISTATFIQDVGFEKKQDGTTAVRNVAFTYNRTVGQKANPQLPAGGGNPNNLPALVDDVQSFQLEVPFLTMIPIPYIRIEEALIEFNAKITSVTEKSEDSSLGVDTEVDAKASFWTASVNMKTNVSYQKKTASSDREERTFDMHIRVLAKNEPMPAGTEKLLNMLENAIKETPKPGGSGAGPDKSKVKPSDTFTDTSVGKLADLKTQGYVAENATTSWTTGQSFKVGALEAYWSGTGTGWKAGTAP